MSWGSFLWVYIFTPIFLFPENFDAAAGVQSEVYMISSHLAIVFTELAMELGKEKELGLGLQQVKQKAQES